MKNLILIIFVLLTYVNVNSQTIYSWSTGVDPGWTNIGALQWRAGCSVVTTNCTGNYVNNLNTTYTSPILNTTCSNASTANISFDIIGNAEYGYDMLYLEYSIDGGLTWVNPYGVGIGWTGNFPALTNISNILPTSNNFRFRFTFTSDYIYRYSGYKISNFQINCNPMLPIELISFDGYKDASNNNLVWSTASEINNDYFTIERSEDGNDWSVVDKVDGSGTTTELKSYKLIDNSFNNVINYYRLKQTDFNGDYEYSDIIVIDNRLRTPNIVKITNLLGQDIDEYYKGVVVIQYDDGTTVKKIQ